MLFSVFVSTPAPLEPTIMAERTHHWMAMSKGESEVGLLYMKCVHREHHDSFHWKLLPVLDCIPAADGRTSK